VVRGVFTRTEIVVAWIVSFLAAAMLSAYIGDAFGASLHSTAILVVSLVAATATSAWLWPSRANDATDLIGFLAVAAAVVSWLLWLARPHLLPIGAGPDLTHHLLLVDYIDRTGRLVHDPALGGYLGEMIDYTPGLHLLAVLAGRWMGRDGLHAIFSVVAASIAIKAGAIFLIAMRCFASQQPDRTSRAALALAAVAMLAFPQIYSFGSFAHDSYLPQVVSELFALTMWLAVLAWDERPSIAAASVFAIAGIAAFLTWPVWLGPPIVTFAVVVWLRGDRLPSERTAHLAVGIAPIALLAAVYLIGRVGASAIAASGGAVPLPSPATIGWLLLTLGPAGAVVAATDRRARPIPILLAAIVLQAAALVVVARARHPTAPYLALKMAYLAIYPLAVGAAYALSLAARRSPQAIAWIASVALLMLAVRSLHAAPRQAPVITDALYDAGRWARTHVPPACVDYLVRDDDSAYWLHLAVLGNPRASARSISSDTYDPPKALERWILPGGLPYAIAEDVDALPMDIRNSVDVLARFGSAAVVRRRGTATRC
jgi:hypothetical protein